MKVTIKSIKGATSTLKVPSIEMAYGQLQPHNGSVAILVKKNLADKAASALDCELHEICGVIYETGFSRVGLDVWQ